MSREIRKGKQQLGPFPAENIGANFDDFVVETEGQRLLYQRAEVIISAISNEDPRTITFFIGAPGCGKTYTAAALSDIVLRLG